MRPVQATRRQRQGISLAGNADKLIGDQLRNLDVCFVEQVCLLEKRGQYYGKATTGREAGSRENGALHQT